MLSQEYVETAAIAGIGVGRELDFERQQLVALLQQEVNFEPRTGAIKEEPPGLLAEGLST